MQSHTALDCTGRMNWSARDVESGVPCAVFSCVTFIRLSQRVVLTHLLTLLSIRLSSKFVLTSTCNSTSASLKTKLVFCNSYNTAGRECVCNLLQCSSHATQRTNVREAG